MLAVVVSFLILLAILAKQAKSQANNASPIVSYTTADLKEFILYKDDPINIERTRIATEIYRAEKLRGKWGGQCVIFARRFLGRAEIKGTARNIKTNSSEPIVGALIKFETGALDHVGVILYVREDSIYYIDSNGNEDEIIQTRWADKTDKNILGYKNFEN